ncbi:hypothetical protein AVP41_00234 [Microbacterium sp. TNHR37B]|nr:hypothetical protein AVP41_00234 [Microbacterium sp. TNHR37B]
MSAICLMACVPETTRVPAPTQGSPERSPKVATAAVAEATYRSYIEALNSDRATTNHTFEADQYLTGSALEGERLSRLQFEREGIRLDGAIRLDSLTPVRSDTSSLLGYVCLDVSETRVLDETETDVTPPDRTPVVGLEVMFLISGDTALISESKAKDGVCS